MAHIKARPREKVWLKGTHKRALFAGPFPQWEAQPFPAVP